VGIRKDSGTKVIKEMKKKKYKWEKLLKKFAQDRGQGIQKGGGAKARTKIKKIQKGGR